jgi:ribonuclease BN (tRNA processing enzyme)
VRLEVLGSAGAAPLQGACASYVVRGGGATLLLDCGPGTLERLWRRRLLGELDAIVISHMHADHVLDLVMLSGEIVQALAGGGRTPLHVPASNGPEVLARLDAAFKREPDAPSRFTRAFDVREYTATDTLRVGEMSLSFAPTAHPPPCLAARVSDGARVLVYGADGSPSAAVEELAHEADVLVLEATLLDDARVAAEHGHMTAIQAGEVATRAGATRLLLTHTLAGVEEQELLERAGRTFAGPLAIARAGYELEF